jgi:hypothetical protein
MSNSQRLIIENVESMDIEELKSHVITQFSRMDDGSTIAFEVGLSELEKRLDPSEYSEFCRMVG